MVGYRKQALFLASSINILFIGRDRRRKKQLAKQTSTKPKLKPKWIRCSPCRTEWRCRSWSNSEQSSTVEMEWKKQELSVHFLYLSIYVSLSRTHRHARRQIQDGGKDRLLKPKPDRAGEVRVLFSTYKLREHCSCPEHSAPSLRPPRWLGDAVILRGGQVRRRGC